MVFHRLPLRPVGRRFASSNSIFQWSTVAEKLPQVPLKSSTTLGELWDAAFVKYKYRAAYPLLGYIGFLYYSLWTP